MLNAFSFRRKRKVPFIEQMQQSECGLCCLAMILRYHGYYVNLPELRQHTDDARQGITLLTLKKLATHYHLEASGQRTSLESLSHMTLPAILFWDRKHYVVLEQMNAHEAIIVDPETGRSKWLLADLQHHYSGVAMSFTPTAEFKSKPASTKQKYAFFQLFWQQKNLLYSILIWSMLIQGIAISIPMLLKYIVDHVLHTTSLQWIHLIGISGLVMMIFYFAFNWIHGQLLIRLQNRLDQSLMHRFIGHLFSLPYAFFQLRSSGDLIMRASSNVAIRQIISNQLISSVINILLIIVLTIYMFTQSFLLASTVLGIALLQTIFVLITRSRLRYLTQAEITAQTQTSGYLTEAVQGISVIKSLGAETGTYRGWDQLFSQQLESTKRKLSFQNGIQSLQSSFLFIAPLLVSWIGAMLVFQQQITLGTLFAFQALVITFLTPFHSLAASFGEVIRIDTLLDRIRDILDTSSEHADGEKTALQLQGNITVQHVSFSYNAKQRLLQNINLTIKSGQKVAIVGQSGSGKSTLAALLAGLYSPASGAIYYDQLPLAEMNKSSLRQRIGMVLQEDLLFNRSILENIRMYNEQVSQHDIVYACQLAHIHDDIIKMPMGYETIISEMGANLSGGQKQRIIMARALARRPAVLIMDEATSALDTITEHIISNNLDQLSCTRIVVAHRMSTIMSADQIILLQHGEITARGTHAHLLQSSAEYRAFYEQKEQERPVTATKTIRL